MTEYGNIIFCKDNQTITYINKTYEGTIVIEKNYGNVDVKIIGENACSYGLIKELNLEKTEIATIKSFAFAFCSKLEKITLPKTLVSLEQNSFSLTAIASIHLPDSIVHFSGDSLNQCNRLNTLTVDEKNNYFISKENCIFSKDFSRLVKAPVNCQMKYIPNII